MSQMGKPQHQRLMYPDNDLVFKLVTIGDYGVGKSRLYLRYAENRFPDEIKTRLAIEFKTRRIALDEQQITLRLFDTFGEEMFQLPTISYYRGSHGVLLVFDLTNEVSFNRVDFWMEKVKEYCDDNVVKVLVGAKADLAEKRTVSFETAKAYADQHGLLYYETSAKTATNVEELFMTLATEIKRRVGDGKLKAEPSMILMRRHETESGWTCGC